MYDKLKSRTMALFFLLFLAFAALSFQLFRIQVLQGDKLAYKALEQRTQKMNLSFPRANFYDSQMIPLTNRKKNEDLIVFPQLIKDKNHFAHFLSPLLNLPEEEILVKLRENVQPFHLGDPLDYRVAKYIEKLNLPGLLVLEEKTRYEDRQLAAHLIGYINAADNKGVSGLERELDPILRKGSGESVIISLDGHKSPIIGLGIKKTQPPPQLAEKKVVLTIDYNWQKIVEEVMDLEVKKGAVVVMDPYSGAILAMASRPNFDPNRVAEYFTQGNAALINRAVVGYPPGSIFKIITASAALEEKSVSLNDRFYCPGYIIVNKLKIACHEKKGHGNVDLVQGFAQSCNPTFITVGLKLGGEKLLQYSRKFGLGKKTKIGLGEERRGQLPKEPLYPGDVANLSIGQGFLEVTPLQAAIMLSTIVNNGERVQPYLIKEIRDAQGKIIEKHQASLQIPVVSPSTAAKVRFMLEKVTLAGTGRGAYVPGIGSAGKTGSAQTGISDKQGEELSHAWFVGYAPSNYKPRWVISVFVEEGKSGGGVAAPVFKKIVERAALIGQSK